MLDAMYAQWAQVLKPWIVPLGGLGALLTSAGIVLSAWASRRRFYRRNPAGVQEFPSYGSAVGNRFVEGLFDRVGALLLCLGLLAALASGYGFYS